MDTIICESMKFTGSYISGLVKGNDKLLYELDSLLDLYLDYYSKFRINIKRDASTMYNFLSGGIVSANYGNCYFSYDEINKISIYITNLCLDDLIEKSLIDINNPVTISQLFIKYNEAIKTKLIRYLNEDKQIDINR